MKSIKAYLLIILVAIGCGKDNATPSTSCSVTFKGTTYSLLPLTCTTIGTTETLQAAGSDGSSLAITKDSDLPDGNTIIFDTDSGGGSLTTEYTVSVPLGNTPTISVSGNKWTFSGTAKNSSGDTGEISGSCTCK